ADVRMGRDHGRHALLETAGLEFYERHLVTRRMVMLSLGFPLAGRAIEVAARPLSLLLAGLRQPAAADRLLAGVFNLAYWRGIADELGAARKAREVIRGQAAAAASQSGGR